MPFIPPGRVGEVELPAEVRTISPKAHEEMYLTVSFLLREPTAWAQAGHTVAWSQHQLKPSEPKLLTNINLFSSKLAYSKNGPITEIRGHDCSFTYDEAKGCITSWVVGGSNILESGPCGEPAIIPSFWRPPTDNDKPHSLPYWKRFGVDVLTSQLRSSRFDVANDSVVITAVTYISPPVLAWGFEATTKYTISSSGTLTIAVELKPTGYIPVHVPRVGLDLRLSRRLGSVKWHGLGPGESYPDKRLAQRMGIWTADSVAELQTPYEVPQENGNRMATRWVQVAEPHGAGVRALAGDKEGWSGNGDREFSWLATRHSTETVQTAKHPCDLVEEEATLLRLDAKVAGVGTAACGPGVREDLLVKVEDMKFSFVLEAVSGL